MVVAGGGKRQATALCTKDEPNVETGAALEIVSSKFTNAQTRMKVRLAESVADCIDCSCDFTPASFR